jgi:hypothetical protein
LAAAYFDLAEHAQRASGLTIEFELPPEAERKPATKFELASEGEGKLKQKA